MKDLNDIFYFAKIIEHGGLSPASEALGVAKSMLSQHLVKLETELGVRLLQRNTRQRKITDVGARFYERCRIVLAEVDRAASVIDIARRSPRGKVRVASPLNFSQAILTPVLTSFMVQYPDVEVLLDTTNRQVDLMAEGYDLVLRIGPSAKSTKLVSRSFNLNRNLLLASPALLARFGTPRTPRSLKSMPSAVGAVPVDRANKYAWDLTSATGRRCAVQHHPRLVTEDLCLLKDSAVAGCGVVDLPSHFCREELQSGRLVSLLPDWSLPLMKLHLIHPPRSGLTLALATLIDYLSTQMRPWIDSAAQGTLHWRMGAAIGDPRASEVKVR